MVERENSTATTSLDVTFCSRSGGQLSQKKSSSWTEKFSACARIPLLRFEFFLIKGNISPLFTSVAVTEWATVAATMLVSPVPDASSRTFLPCSNFCLASRKSESNRAPRHTCKCVNLFLILNFPDYHLEPNKVNTAACAMRYSDRGERNVVVAWNHFERGLHIWDNDLLQE